jgi:ESCRT-II complex subunit VPS22
MIAHHILVPSSISHPFQTLAGVDPLSSEKGFWGSMLGMGEFYHELSVKVAEVCIASRSRNGGIIRLEFVCIYAKSTL